MIVSSVPDTKDSPFLLGMDREDVDEISSASRETPSPFDPEPYEGSSSAHSQRLPRIFGGLPTPELDQAPFTIFEEQATSCSNPSDEPELEATPHFVSESSTGIAEQWPHPSTIGTRTETVANNGDGDDRVTSIADSVRQGDESSPDDLPNTEQPLAGIHDESLTPAQEPETTPGRYSLSPAEEPRLTSQTFTTSNELSVNYTTHHSRSLVEVLQSDIHVSALVTTNSVVENSQKMTVCEEPSLDNDAPDATSEPHNDAVATPMIGDVTDQLPAPAPASPVPSQAEVLVGPATSKLPEECPMARVQTSPVNQTSDEVSRLAETDPASIIIDVRTTSSGDVNGRFGNGDYGIATDNREISHTTVHDPASLSSAYTLSPSVPSSPYPLRMVMRKATHPVLFADPYPYSLSTPGQPQDDASDDEETEQEYSLSSSSTFDKYSDDRVKESDVITAPNKGAQDTELQSSSVSVEVDDSGPVDTPRHTESIEGSVPEQNDVDSDTDADGDADPEFTEVDLIPSSTRSSSTNGVGVVEDPFRDTDVKSSANQGEDKIVQPTVVHNNDGPATEQQNR
jgi:hypothetical protein